MSRAPLFFLAFSITKIAPILRGLDDFVTESAKLQGMSTFQSDNALLCQAMCSTETETWDKVYVFVGLIWFEHISFTISYSSRSKSLFT